MQAMEAGNVQLILQAFLAASMKSDEELMGWFRERLVWNDPAVVMDLLKNGLFVRLYTPQVMHLDLTCLFLLLEVAWAQNSAASAADLCPPQSSGPGQCWIQAGFCPCAIMSPACMCERYGILYLDLVSEQQARAS